MSWRKGAYEGNDSQKQGSTQDGRKSGTLWRRKDKDYKIGEDRAGTKKDLLIMRKIESLIR